MIKGEIKKYNLSDELRDEIDSKLSSGDIYTKAEVDELIRNISSTSNNPVYDSNNNGIVDTAETLSGLTVSIDELNTSIHSHPNQDILDNFSETPDGKLLYKTNKVDVVSLKLKYELLMTKLKYNRLLNVDEESDDCIIDIFTSDSNIISTHNCSYNGSDNLIE